MRLFSMTTTRTRAIYAAQARSANDRFKARWQSYMAWSTTTAVVVHAAFFAFSPSWETSSPQADSPVVEGQRLLSLGPLEDAAGTPAAPPAPLLAGGESEAGASDAGPADRRNVVALAGNDLWRALGERMRHRGGVLPRLAQPESEAEVHLRDREEVDEDPTGEPLSVGGEAGTTDLSSLPEPGSLDLDRLNSIRPELAVATPSAWVLIRNPLEVEAFLRRGYARGTLDPTVVGSVSVTLWINRYGKVEWAEVSKSSGRPELDEYALALFNEVASFRAARERGVTVSRSVTLLVNFPW
jgi:TonB family protein